MADNKTQIVITAEDKTAAAFASAKAGLEKFSAAYATLGSLAGIAVGGGLAATIRSTINLGDEMNDLSQRVGISVQNLGTWSLAASQSGTSIESVAKGVKGLSQYMVANGEALKKAGVTATDANGAMIQLADIFAAMPDGVQKTALAVQIFGKSGMDMIPMLNIGSKGLSEAAEKAEDYGKRLAELAPMADKFNDQIAELALQSKAAGINMATLVAGPMTSWLEANNEAIRIAGGAAEALRLFVFNLDAMTSEKPAEEIRRLTKALQEFQEAGAVGKFMQSPTGYLFGGREEDLKKQVAFLKFLQRQQVMADASNIGDYRDARDLRLAGRSTMSQAEAMAKAQRLLDKEKIDSAAKKQADDLARMVKLGQKNELDAYYSTGGEETMREVGAKQAQKSAEAARREGDALERLRKHYADLADPLQKYREQLDQIEQLKQIGREAGGLDADQAIAAAMRVNDAMDAEIAKMNDLGKAAKEVDTFARDMGLSFASAFEDAVIGGKSLQDVIKGLGQDIERIVLRKTVTEPLGNAVADMVKGSSFGGGGGLFGGIKNLFGFASGGAFTVGGAGGTDSQLVAFKATPGEEVTVRTPGQQAGGGAIVINQSISVDSRSDQASIMVAMVQAKNAAIAEIHNSMRRGGAFA